jgi:hemerythrin-like domain-containing protein
MDTLALGDRTGLPDALRALSDAFPRDGWQGHENFGQMIQFWLQRHQMFRQLLQVLEADVQGVIDGNMGFQDYAPRLQHYAGLMLNELHAHHHIEDSHYFPKLIRLDARAEQGFALLDADHHAMDGLLHGVAEAANAVLQGAEAGVFADRLTAFGGLLNRHLLDEEDIVVPVILKSGFDG